MAIQTPKQTIISPSGDPGLAIYQANTTSGVYVFETTKDIYVTAIDQQVTQQFIKNQSIVNDIANIPNAVQFNVGGNFVADQDFTYSANTDTLNIKNLNVTGIANLGSNSNITISGGTSGYFLQTDGAGNLSWAVSGGSGNGETGGTNTQVQFNDSGNFGGNAGFTFNKTTGLLNAPSVTTGNLHSTTNTLLGDNTTPGQYYIYRDSNQVSIGAVAGQTIDINGNGISIGGTGGVTVQGVAGSNVTIGGGTTGNVVFPDGITFDDGTLQTTAYPGAPEPTDRLVNGIYEAVLGSDAKLTLPGVLEMPSSGSINFAYGYVSQDTSANSIQISSGTGVDIQTDENGHTWSFGSNASLTFPDGTSTTGAGVTVPLNDAYTITTSIPDTATALCYIANGTEFVADTEFNQDITVVQVGWTVMVGSTQYTVTSIDPSPPAHQYRITVAGATFVQGQSYTFTNPTPISSTWTFGEGGNLTLPSNTSSINYANGQPYTSGAANSLVNGNANVFLSSDGVLNLPVGRGYTYNAPLVGYGSGAAVQFELNSDLSGTETQWTAAITTPGTGYAIGDEYTFDSDFLQIPGASVTITVAGIDGDGGVTDISFTPPPLYPTSLYREDGFIALQANDKRWTFGLNGFLSLPGGAKITTNSTSVDLVPGPGGYAELASNNGDNYVWVTDDGAYIGTNGLDSFKQWSFAENGNLTYPDNTITSGSNINIPTGNTFAVTTSSIESVSAPCFIAEGDRFVADIENNDDITVVQVGWTVNVGGTIYTVTDIDPSPPIGQYIIIAAGATFVEAETYTFTNPVPASHTWSIDQYGVLTAPGNGTISQINNDFFIGVANTDVIGLRTEGGDVILDAQGNLNIPGQLISTTSASRLSLNENGGGGAYLTSTDNDTTAVFLRTNDVQMYAGINQTILAGTILPGLETDYTDSRILLEDLFTQNAGLPGYPWGITLPVSYLTYSELILLPSDTFPNQDACTVQANNTNNRYELWQGTISETNVTITANENSWVFDGYGNLTLPTNTSSINYANGQPYGGGGGGNASALVNGDNSFVLDDTGNVVFEGAAPGEGVDRGMVWDYGSNANGVNSELRQDNNGITIRAWTENGGGANGYSAPVNIVTNQDATTNTWRFDGSGNLTVPSNGSIIAINDGGQLGSQILLNPDLGQTKLAARSTEYTQNFTSTDWIDAEYTGTQVNITDAPGLLNFVANNSTFNASIGATFSINGGEPVLYQGYSDLGSNNVVIYTNIAAEPDPTTVTTIDFYYQLESYIGVDYDGSVEVYASGLTINIDNDQTQGPDINLRSGDDILLQAKDKNLGTESEGGDINIYAGDGAGDDGQGNTSSGGGDIQIIAGVGGFGNSSSGGTGGFSTLRGGQGGIAGVSSNAGSGGYVQISAGSGGDNNGNTQLGAGGGYVSINGGDSTQQGVNGGAVTISSGLAGSGALAGNVEITTPVSDLGDGGTWRFDGSGNLTLPSTGNINGADGSWVRIQSLESGNVRSGVTLNPGYGITRLESWDNQNSQGFTTTDWATGEYIDNGSGGEIAFTNTPAIRSFFDTIFTSRLFYQVNGGNLLPSVGWGGGGDNIVFYTSVPPATSPETVNDFVIYYSNKSTIEMDYDEGEMNINSQGLDVNIQSDQSIDMISNDIIRIQNSGNTSGVAIITNPTNGFNTWNFGSNGSVTLPTISVSEGLDEQTVISSQRKLIPPFRWSAVLSGSTPAVVYNATNVNTTSMKVTMQIQHQGLGMEFFEVFATMAGSDTYYTVGSRVAPPTIDPSTVVVGLGPGNIMQITVTVNSGVGTSWVTYDAVEFGIPND